MGDTKGWFTIGLVVAYIVAIALYFDKMVLAMQSAPIMTALGIYLLGKPGYLLIIYFMVTSNKGDEFKSFIAGLLVVFMIDIIDFPRLSTISGDSGAAAITNSDSIFFKLFLSKGISYTVAWWVYYVAIPVILIIMVAYIMGVVTFEKKINSMGRL